MSPDLPPLVLASGSVYRKQLLDDAGIAVTVDPPDIDERLLDDEFTVLGAEGVALELARRKAAVVAARRPGAAVIAGDQVGVLDRGDGTAIMLTKQADADAAVDQLMALSGTTHRLVNGLVVLAPDGRAAEGVDVQEVTMRRFTRTEAVAYVDAFEPWDTSGSYRLEDQDRMDPGAGFVTGVRGEDRSGVLGLPVPLLRRLLSSLMQEGPPAVP